MAEKKSNYSITKNLKAIYASSPAPTKAELVVVSRLLSEYSEEKIREAFLLYVQVTPPQYQSILQFYKKRHIFFSPLARKALEALEVINQKMSWKYKIDENIFYSLFSLLMKGFSLFDIALACDGMKTRFYEDYAYDRPRKLSSASWNIFILLERFQDFLHYRKQKVLEAAIRKAAEEVAKKYQPSPQALPHYKKDRLYDILAVLARFYTEKRNSLLVVNDTVAKAFKLHPAVVALIKQYPIEEAVRRYRKMKVSFGGFQMLSKCEITMQELEVFVLTENLSLESIGKKSIFSL